MLSIIYFHDYLFHNQLLQFAYNMLVCCQMFTDAATSVVVSTSFGGRSSAWQRKQRMTHNKHSTWQDSQKAVDNTQWQCYICCLWFYLSSLIDRPAFYRPKCVKSNGQIALFGIVCIVCSVALSNPVPTKLNNGLSRLHSVDEDAVSWLTSYGSWHVYEKK